MIGYESAKRRRPTEEVALALAAQCLAHQGLTAQDIAAALDVHASTVDRMLARPEHDPINLTTG